MPSSKITSLGPFTVADGQFKLIRPQDYGGGQIQFAVSTNQAIGDTLYGFLGDENGSPGAPIHPGPPITFETPSAFSLVASGSAVTFYVICVQGNFTQGLTGFGQGIAQRTAAGATSTAQFVPGSGQGGRPTH
jgi:hypothetical protein